VACTTDPRPQRVSEPHPSLEATRTEHRTSPPARRIIALSPRVSSCAWGWANRGDSIRVRGDVISGPERHGQSTLRGNEVRKRHWPPARIQSAPETNVVCLISLADQRVTSSPLSSSPDGDGDREESERRSQPTRQRVTQTGEPLSPSWRASSRSQKFLPYLRRFRQFQRNRSE
jgi:hypothetical protein